MALIARAHPFCVLVAATWAILAAPPEVFIRRPWQHREHGPVALLAIPIGPGWLASWAWPCLFQVVSTHEAEDQKPFSA